MLKKWNEFVNENKDSELDTIQKNIMDSAKDLNKQLNKYIRNPKDQSIIAVSMRTKTLLHAIEALEKK